MSSVGIVKNIEFTPENIFPEMSCLFGVDFAVKRKKWFNEMDRRLKIINSCIVAKRVQGTVVTKITDSFHHEIEFRYNADELGEEEDCETDSFYPDYKEILEINSINDNEDLIRYLEGKFEKNIRK